MKKLIALFLALAVMFGLVGCISVVEVEDEFTGLLIDEFSEYSEEVFDEPFGEEFLPEAESDAFVGTEFEDLPATDATEASLDYDGWCYSVDNVSLYLYIYGELPENFITKSEARDLGWEGGSVEKYAPGYAIGGDVFGNREGLLPEAEGRIYYECDIDTDGQSSRGAKRIVFSNDGLIYYTDDHYETFELLYGEE